MSERHSAFRNNLFVSTEHGSEGVEEETSTDEPSFKMCTWRPDKEETTGPTLHADSSDVTLTASAAFTEYFQKDGETAMAASLPAAKESDARQEATSGTPQRRRRTAGVRSLYR